MSRVLIIGYGNSLRSDDAIGVRAAESLAEFYRTDPDICVVTAQQLAPEMARDIAEAGFVLFVDASADQPAGTICCEDLSGGEAGVLFTHHCSPTALLDAALVLYGRVPRAAVSLTMSGESFALGQELSPTVQAQMPKFLAQAKQTVLQWVSHEANDPKKASDVFRRATATNEKRTLRSAFFRGCWPRAGTR